MVGVKTILPEPPWCCFLELMLSAPGALACEFSLVIDFSGLLVCFDSLDLAGDFSVVFLLGDCSLFLSIMNVNFEVCFYFGTFTLDTPLSLFASSSKRDDKFYFVFLGLISGT